ncbi:hypothetical protein ACET3Z_031519 [Daucus carota]
MSSTASSNRLAGGQKAKGTYKGGSISQLQHITTKESQSPGVSIDWVDVYVATPDGLPDAINTAENYRRLFDERYPEGTERPDFDQELWETASVVKKNYVKGGHLGAIDPGALARAVEAAAASRRADDTEGSRHDDQEDESGGT